MRVGVIAYSNYANLEIPLAKHSYKSNYIPKLKEGITYFIIVCAALFFTASDIKSIKGISSLLFLFLFFM